MDDSTWYLESHEDFLQAAYTPLTGPPLFLDTLHPLRRNLNPVDRKLYTILHTLLCHYELWFNEVVQNILTFLDTPTPRGIFINARVRCWQKLESELERVKEEVEAAMQYSLSSATGHDAEGGSVADIKIDIAEPGTPALLEPALARLGTDGSPLPSSPKLITSRISPSKRMNDQTGEAPISPKRRRSAASSSDDFDELFSTPPPFSSPPSALPFLSKSTSATAWGLDSRAELGNRSAFSRTDTTSSETSTTTTTSPISTATTLFTTSDRTLLTSATSIDTASAFLYIEDHKQSPSSAWTPYPAVPCSDCETHIVPENSYQHVFDKKAIHFAVQWEFERLIALHPSVTWSDVLRQDIEHLRGTASEVIPRLKRVMGNILCRKTAMSIPASDLDWPGGPGGRSSEMVRISQSEARLHREMDSEEESIRANNLKGLGFGDVDWLYGGKIIYTISVQPIDLHDKHTREKKAANGHTSTPMTDPANPVGPAFGSSVSKKKMIEFACTLRPPDMSGKSYRLARRFGSRRIINLKFKDLKSPELMREATDWLAGRPLVLFGRTYRAVWAPSGKDSVFCIETTEHGKLGSRSSARNWEPPMPSFEDILSIFNDPSRKPSQPMAKWAARPQILFSDSIPGTRVEPDAIGYEEDIVSYLAPSYADATTEQTLTDGCGLMSEAFAQRLAMARDGPRPYTVQMRLGGTKGLLCLMSEKQHAQYPGKDVVIRDSMIKSLPAPKFANDPSLLIADIVRYSSLRIGTSLTFEAIVAMAHGGVPEQILLDRAAQGLDDLKALFDPYPADGETAEDVMNRLIGACYREGGVGTDRRKRACEERGVSTKVAGLSFKKHDDVDKADNLDGLDIPAQEEADVNAIGPIDRYGVDPISGQSNSIAESLMDALCAGFHPLESQYTGFKLHSLVSTLSRKMIRRFKIPVEQSLTAFIVPDALQVLAPDEIYISFSSDAPIDPITKCPIMHLRGPVLAYRSPCKLPTDVRKFAAVYKVELAHLKDCIVLSANSDLCTRSPASFLGGGDYDGDTVQLIWDQSLVEPFTNAPEKIAEVPDEFVQDNFEKEVMTVKEFLETIDNGRRAAGVVRGDEENQSELKIANMQKFLLGGLEDDKSYGSYSDWHGNAVYTLGLDHPETIRLGRMFCHVLDARKSGLRVRPSVKAADAVKYGGSLVWRDWKNDTDNEMINPVYRQRPYYLGSFILDRLMDAGEAKRDEVLGHFPSELKSPSKADYLALSKYWSQAKLAWEATKDEDLGIAMDVMRTHVKICCRICHMVRAGNFPESTTVSEIYDGGLHLLDTISTPSKKQRSYTSGLGSGTPKGKGKSKQRAKVAKAEDDLRTLMLIRSLAVVWRDRLRVEDVPLLCGFGDEELLKKMKIGCAAEIMTTESNRYINRSWPFDMDFDTTCALKAESKGRTRTVLDSVLTNMKPTTQAKFV